MNAIEVTELTKRYAQITALREVSLAVPQRSLFGLLGPNGAGKTTLIKALVGALRPTSGSVRVLGLEPLADKAALRAQIGYMPQSTALYEDLSARENIRFFGSAHGTGNLQRRVEEVLAFTELTARANDPVHSFSGGMKKRVSLACALIHQPQMLFLDEPTAAVDPQLKMRSWRLFRELAAQGVTLLISTHLMDEALLCDYLAVLRQGQVIVVDTPQRILERGRTRLTVLANGTPHRQTIGSRAQDLAAALQAYGLTADVSAIQLDADTLEMVVLSMINEEQTP